MLALLKASESAGHPSSIPSEVPSRDGTAHPLHERALRAAGQFRRAEAELIEALLAVDCERVFLKLGYPSLFRYAVEALKLSEDTAYNFVTVARKSRETPVLLSKIQEGSLTVSKARKIAPVLKLENQIEWIERAQTLTSRQLEKEVARENPRLATPEKAKYVSGKRLELTLGVEEFLMLKIRRAQDLVSRSKSRAVTLEETLEELADYFLKDKDPVERAKRVIAKKGVQPSQKKPSPLKPPQTSLFQSSLPQNNSPETSSVRFSVPGRENDARTPIPAHIAHQVRLRDQGQCQYQRDGDSICGSRRWTDLHHIQPVSQGGAHSVDNLMTLCKAHHQQTHRDVDS